MFDRIEDPTGLELTLRRIALGARLLGLGWFALLASLTLVRGVETPGWVVGPLLAAVAWGVISLGSNRRSPDAVTSRLAIGIDMALASIALIAPEQAGVPAIGFYGGYPLITVTVAAVRSRRSGFLTASWLILVVLGGFRTRPEGLVASLSQILLYLVAALIVSWAVGAIRMSDGERRRAQEAATAAEAQRARAEERSQMSRHLHDSVLQTLALIQANTDEPREVAGLARRQERELREWLFGAPVVHDGFAAALRKAGASVEDDYRIPVEVVVVGDVAAHAGIDALVAAAREAIVNAAKHADCESVAVYGEVANGQASVFVRDRGVGFDAQAVGPDRKGISESIVGRLEKVGGSARLRTEPGGGTEWKLSV